MIDRVIEVVNEASAAILEVYRSDDFDMSLKADRSPLTRADLESSRILVAGLEAFSGLRVVSEEREIPYSERRQLQKFWLVDPLDGTKDFLERDDEFTVNVALISNGIPVLGVVAAPALGLVYGAEKAKGAFRMQGSERRGIKYQSSRTNLICADSRFHSSDKIQAFCKQNGISEILRSGSAIKMCKLAEGEVDVYPRFGPTMEWDVAASQVIAEEAGCEVMAMASREPLRYNKEDLRNPEFIAFPRGRGYVF